MQSINVPASVQRVSESGYVWQEKISGSTGTLKVPGQTPFRVRAAGAADTTVTINGVLAATMAPGEIMIFNSGEGTEDDRLRRVDIVIGNDAAYVQVAQTKSTCGQIVSR